MANLGLHHPVYNSTGARLASDSLPWYSTTVAFNSTADCFNLSKLDLTSGIIGGATGSSNQYEYADAIYAGLVEDLRLNANKLDLNRLLEDSKRSDVAGTTRGKGKVPFSKVFFETHTVVGSGNSVNSTGIGDFVVVGSRLRFEQADGSLYEGEVTSIDSSDLCRVSPNWLVGKTVGNYIIAEVELSAEYDSIPHVDLVGDPANIALTFPDGVIGEWIPVIPDGSSISFNLNRKLIEHTGRLETNDNGASWGIGAVDIGIDTTDNTYTDTTPNIRVVILQYESLSDFTEPSVNLEVLNSVDDVMFLPNSDVTQGNRLHPSLVGQCSTSNNDVPVEHALISYDKTTFISHTPLLNPAPTNADSNAVKVSVGIVDVDGLLYPQYGFEELKHDATDWGDTNILLNRDNDTTYTNDNAVTCKAGTHIGKIPLGIA